jgi:hypothetical protein
MNYSYKNNDNDRHELNYSSKTSPVQQLHPPLKSSTPFLVASFAPADGLPRPKYPPRNWTTDDADEVIEFDRARGGLDTGSDVEGIQSCSLGREIGGRSIPVCSSRTAGPFSTLDKPKNDSLFFSFGGVGVLDLDGKPQDFILFPFTSGEEGRGVGGIIVGLGGGNLPRPKACEGRIGWNEFAVCWKWVSWSWCSSSEIRERAWFFSRCSRSRRDIKLNN